jgi:hypothetical protein
LNGDEESTLGPKKTRPGEGLALRRQINLSVRSSFRYTNSSSGKARTPQQLKWHIEAYEPGNGAFRQSIRSLSRSEYTDAPLHLFPLAAPSSTLSSSLHSHWQFLALNMVERFFARITTQRPFAAEASLRCDNFKPPLMPASQNTIANMSLRAVTGWREPKPFTWTVSADSIFRKFENSLS